MKNTFTFECSYTTANVAKKKKKIVLIPWTVSEGLTTVTTKLWRNKLENFSPYRYRIIANTNGKGHGQHTAFYTHYSQRHGTRYNKSKIPPIVYFRLSTSVLLCLKFSNGNGKRDRVYGSLLNSNSIPKYALVVVWPRCFSARSALQLEDMSSHFTRLPTVYSLRYRGKNYLLYNLSCDAVDRNWFPIMWRPSLIKNYTYRACFTLIKKLDAVKSEYAPVSWSQN